MLHKNAHNPPVSFQQDFYIKEESCLFQDELCVLPIQVGQKPLGPYCCAEKQTNKWTNIFC